MSGEMLCCREVLDSDVPVIVPPTAPDRYISFFHALNLRVPGEDTGDWHGDAVLFVPAGLEVHAPLAGRGQRVDSCPSLGTSGVRDMAETLVRERMLDRVDGPVYVANHPRAIADLVLYELDRGYVPGVVNSRSINQYLDTESQVDDLAERYLAPLSRQLSGESLALHGRFMETVFYET